MPEKVYTLNAGFLRSCQAKKGPLCLGGSSLRLRVWGWSCQANVNWARHETPYQVRDREHEELDQGNDSHCPFEPEETR